jgi:cold shock CspA family protein/ribosome-associated translation inhibitor RaiA
MGEMMERQIDARNVTMLPEWETKIDEEIEKLQGHHPGIVHHIRVTIIGTKHHRRGFFDVHLVTSVPGGTLVVKRNGEKVRPLVVSCFDTLDRQLREYDRGRQGIVKPHEERPSGTVYRILPADGYGFLKTSDGEEVYFHRNALDGVTIEDLSAGDNVAFAAEMGEKGLQATWVRRS